MKNLIIIMYDNIIIHHFVAIIISKEKLNHTHIPQHKDLYIQLSTLYCHVAVDYIIINLHSFTVGITNRKHVGARVTDGARNLHGLFLVHIIQGH